MDEKSQQNDDNNIIRKIAPDIPILNGVCDLQSKLNVEVNEMSIAHIFEDLLMEPTMKFQSSMDVLNDNVRKK